MKKLTFFLGLIGPICLFAQSDFILKGEVKDLPERRIFLMNFYGEKNTVIDSAMTDSSGGFSFSIPPSAAPGLYRAGWGKDAYVDLVFDKENITFRTDAVHPADSLKIVESRENKLYYDFLERERINRLRLDLLQQVVDYWPDRDPFYFEAAGNYESTQRMQHGWIDSLERKHPHSYTVRMLSLYQTPFLPASLSSVDRMTFLKQHFFDNVDFSDTALLRSNAWPNKAIAYLALYSNNRLTQKQLEAEFIKAVTVMLSAAGANPEIFKFLLDYLVSGFDKFHFEEVIAYLAENFQDPYACEDPDKKSALQKKLETFKKIAIGQPAPDFEVPDPEGKPVKLSGIHAEFTLLLFWSSECGHCTDMMPKVKALYDAQRPKRYEILAVSIDTSRTSWMEVVTGEDLRWINASELEGFDGRSADLYNIYATPTMFLLERDKKIVAKPISYRELEAALRAQGLL